MFEAELNEQRANRSDLHALPTARVADFSGFDVIFAVWLREPKRGEALDR